MADPRSFAVLYAAREGDGLLWDGRATPLEVVEVFDNGVKVRGPRGGRYRLENRDDGQIHAIRVTNGAYNHSGPISGLEFAQIAVDDDYSDAIAAIQQRTQRLMASDQYDYSEWGAAADDAAVEWIIEDATEDQLRAAVAGGDIDDRLMGNAPPRVESEWGHMGPAAYAVLSQEAHEAGRSDGGTTMRNDLVDEDAFGRIVDQVVTRVDNERRGPRELEEHVDDVVRDLLDDYSTAEHAELVDQSIFEPERSDYFGQVRDLVPWGERSTLRDQAVSVVSQAALRTLEREEKAELRAKDGPIRAGLDDYADAIVEEDVDAMSMVQQPDTPKLPLMKDGGMPHTLMDEARMLYMREVPVIAGDWVLEDAGLVTDGKRRMMTWMNPEKREMLVIAGKKRATTNDWGVYSYSFRRDRTEELFRGTKFTDALDAAVDYLSPDRDEATLEIVEDTDRFVSVVDDVDHEALGRHVLTRTGFYQNQIDSLVNSIPSPVRSTARGTARAGAWAGGKAAQGGAWVGRRIWDRYGYKIGGLVLMSLVASLAQHSGRVIQGAEGEVIVEPDRLGIDWIYKKGVPLIDEDGNSRLDGYEPVLDDSGNIQRNDDGEIFMREVATGETEWMNPKIDEEKARYNPTINPYKWGIDRGLTMAWGIEYEEIVDLFEEWGEDAVRATAGTGERSKREGRHVSEPESTGAPSSNPYRDSAKKRRQRRRRRQSGRSDGGSKTKSSSDVDGPSSFAEAGYDIDEDDEDRFFNELSKWRDRAQTVESFLADDDPEPRDDDEDADEDDGGDGDGGGDDDDGSVPPPEEDQDDDTETQSIDDFQSDGGQKPQTAEEVEEAVGDADRMEQLEFHAQEPNAPDVVADEDDVKPDPDDYAGKPPGWTPDDPDSDAWDEHINAPLEERKESYREAREREKREEAADYLDTAPEDIVEGVTDAVDELDEIRDQRAEEQDEDDDKRISDDEWDQMFSNLDRAKEAQGREAADKRGTSAAGEWTAGSLSEGPSDEEIAEDEWIFFEEEDEDPAGR